MKLAQRDYACSIRVSSRGGIGRRVESLAKNAETGSDWHGVSGPLEPLLVDSICRRRCLTDTIWAGRQIAVRSEAGRTSMRRFT
jgi:hypothetical protein